MQRAKTLAEDRRGPDGRNAASIPFLAEMDATFRDPGQNVYTTIFTFSDGGEPFIFFLDFTLVFHPSLWFSRHARAASTGMHTPHTHTRTHGKEETRLHGFERDRVPR